MNTIRYEIFAPGLITNLPRHNALCGWKKFEPARPYVYVTIEEVRQGNWGVPEHPPPDRDFRFRKV